MLSMLRGYQLRPITGEAAVLGQENYAPVVMPLITLSSWIRLNGTKLQKALL